MRTSSLFRFSLLLFTSLLSLVGCTMFRANPLDQKRGAVVMIFDTRTAGDMKSLRAELSAADAKATVFVGGQISRGTANMIYDACSEGHEFGLSGLKGVDPQSYSMNYGRQKYFQDEIVTQVLDAERNDLTPRYFLLTYRSKMKADTMTLPAFLVSKGFTRVIDLIPDYVPPTPIPASTSSHDPAPVVHAYRLTEKNFNPAQIATLAKRNQILVIAPNRQVLPDLLSEAHAQGVPFVTVAELK